MQDLPEKLPRTLYVKYIITEGDFRQLAETISVIQKAIDDVNELLIGGEKVGEFVFQSECYLI